ncbi:fimbrial biogenesis chaperone [Pantoea stewartii]|uniref:fimbrial biogenesis chaperone n=1 Tax=Pantoea stewartii TaxID=66269 RepID=UPI0015622F18|nr:molecular chaperone [Pantoea stewartii]NRH23228.1 phytochrome sensor protein [Pantoea stewartii]
MKVNSYLKKILFTLFLVSGVSQAAVVMNASRVVMEGTLEKTITFDNTSENPFIVQIEPDNSRQPDFIAMPPIFKIKERGGQTVKIRLLSPTLPQDKESLFYLNFTQIPGLKKSESDDSRLNIIVKSRLKIIYRPKSVNAFSAKEERDVSYSIQNGTIVVSNNSPNVLSIREIMNGKHIIAENLTLKPGDTFSKEIKGNSFSGPLHAVMISDYGTPVNFLIADK